MKTEEMRTKSVLELNKLVDKLTMKVAHTKTDLYTKEIKNPREIRSHKREIARINTIIREKEEEK